MLQIAEKNRKIHFAGKCKLPNEGCPIFYPTVAPDGSVGEVISSTFLMITNTASWAEILSFYRRELEV